MRKTLVATLVALLADGIFAADWQYDSNAKTISDGVWTFNASISGSNLTVNQPVDGAPIALSDLDFSKKIVDSADSSTEYTIVGLNCAFNNHAALKVLVGKLTLPGEGLTTVSKNCFLGCTAMTGDLKFPATLIKVEDAAFNGTKITSVYIAPTVNQCTLYGSYGGSGAFGSNSQLTNVTFAAGGQVKTWCSHIFGSCAKLVKAELYGAIELETYPGREDSDSYALFNQCPALEEIILGPGLTNLVQNSLCGQNNASLKTVRFLGPPPTRFLTPYLYSIGKTQKVMTYVPNEYKAEWAACAANGELASVGTTWAADYVSSGIDLTYRPLLLAESEGTELPTIESVERIAYDNSTTEAKIKVSGVNLIGGTITIVVSNATAEVTRLDGLTDFGTYTIDSLTPATSYSATIVAANKNGAVAADLAIKTFAVAAERTAQAFYDPTAKIFAFHYDLIDRSGIDGFPCYAITGASTWTKDTTVKTATQVLIDSSFADYMPTSCSEWFADLNSVTEIVGLENLDVSESTSLYGLFRGVPVETLDLSRFKTSLVTDFGGMFQSCRKLTTIYANENFSLGAMTSDYRMFYYMDVVVGGSGTKYSNDHIDSEYARVDDPDNDKPGYFTYKAPPVVAPTITTVSFQAVSNEAVTVCVYGYDLQGGTITIELWSGGEVAKSREVDAFGEWGFSGLTGATEYTVKVTATNVAGSSEGETLSFSTWGKTTLAARAAYTDYNKRLSFYYDDFDRSGSDATVYEFNDACSCTWSEVKGSAQSVLFDATFYNFKATTCSEWFADFSKVTAFLGMEYFDVSQATGLYALFRGTAITSIDLSYFKTSRVTNFGHIFRACGKLVTIYANENFSLGAKTADEYTFLNNDQLVGGSGTKYTATKINSSEYARVDDPDNDLPGYFTYKAPPAVKPSITSVSIQAVSNETATVCVYGDDLQGGTITIELLTDGAAAKSKEVDAWGEHAFTGLTGGTEYTVKVAATNTAGTTEDESCSFSTWGTTTLAARAVYTAYNDTLTFYYDDVDRSGSDATIYDFNAKCEKTWDAAKNLIRYIVFDDTFRNFRPTSCANWFAYARGKGENGLYFRGWKNLNTSKVTNMGKMFYYCKLLENPDLTYFDTRKVTSFAQFTGYGGWDPFDVSSFDTRSATDMGGMFNGCTTIYANERFVTTKVTGSNNMFASKLIIGGAGTKYSSEHASDKEYARIDDPDNGKPGYFTYKARPHQGLIFIVR